MIILIMLEQIGPVIPYQINTFKKTLDGQIINKSKHLNKKKSTQASVLNQNNLQRDNKVSLVE